MVSFSLRFQAVARVHNTLPRRGPIAFEQLESRNLLSAGGLTATQAVPLLSFSPAASSPSAAGSGGPTIYTPAQIRHAYGFDQVSFSTSRGAVVGNGAGQTIAIIDAYNDPTIKSDLAAFDSTFRLAAPPSFTQVSEYGGSASGLAVNAGWSMEISLDVEWAHAMAPNANILLVEARSDYLSDLLTAVNYARHQPGVSTVTMSWGGSEFSSESSYDQYFTAPAGHAGITFVASAGDDGAPASWPAVSANVVAVGGTSLYLTGSGSYGSETGWSAGGGGRSLFESEPTFQLAVQSSGKRDAPDVAYDADPNSGLYVYDSVPYDGYTGWWDVGGTSAGAPQWAALLAIADQGRALLGAAPLNSAAASLYAIPRGDFHDVTAGNNGYTAGPGYDMVTGLGTPLANAVIQDLVGPKPAAAATVPPLSMPTTRMGLFLT